MSVLTTAKETLNKAEGILLYLIAQVFFFFEGHIIMIWKYLDWVSKIKEKLK